jgi:hypothetical protein
VSSVSNGLYFLTLPPVSVNVKKSDILRCCINVYKLCVGSSEIHRGSSVSLVTRLRAAVPGRGKKFLSHPKASRPALGPTQPLVHGSVSELKWPGSVRVRIRCRAGPGRRPRTQHGDHHETKVKKNQRLPLQSLSSW